MHWIIIMMFYVFMGFIGSKIYHFNGFVDILLWPLAIFLKLLSESKDERKRDD